MRWLSNRHTIRITSCTSWPICTSWLLLVLSHEDDRGLPLCKRIFVIKHIFAQSTETLVMCQGFFFRVQFTFSCRCRTWAKLGMDRWTNFHARAKNQLPTAAQIGRFNILQGAIGIIVSQHQSLCMEDVFFGRTTTGTIARFLVLAGWLVTCEGFLTTWLPPNPPWQLLSQGLDQSFQLGHGQAARPGATTWL